MFLTPPVTSLLKAPAMSLFAVTDSRVTLN